ncbi:Uncharacterised protein [uncultured archaeon]|nr:Uncharacterised protein [uncultured archaeon]
MFILDENNTPKDLNLIPNQTEMNFWIFDNTAGAKDYFCIPLIMIESFYAPTIKLKLTSEFASEFFINVPSDFQILIGEPTYGDLEINPITSLSGRGFKAFSLNPEKGFRPEYLNIEVVDILPSIRWFMPKTKVGQLICIPLSKNQDPECIFLVRDMPKNIEIIKTSDAY